MNSTNYILKILTYLLIFIFLKSCGIYRPTDAKDFPPEPEKRVQKNIQEGRGFKLLGGNKKKGGDFEFASSNEMWRASLDILEFMPLLSADYGGGLIITDWYSENNNDGSSIKISIRFLSNEIRSDGLDIKVFNKKCDSNNSCKIIKGNFDLESELKVAILKKAAIYNKEKINKVKKRSLSTIKVPSDK
tara:strand:+ start:1768 stop:2334 length:567 start_codon:yes stop_codon:yes gene_type:complete